MCIGYLGDGGFVPSLDNSNRASGRASEIALCCYKIG